MLFGELRLLRFELGALPLEFCGGSILLLLVQNYFVGTFAVDGCSVFFHERRLVLDHCGFRLVGRGRHQALRRQDFRILDDRRSAVFIEEAHERLACAQLQNGVFALETRIGSKRLRCCLNGFLFGGRICSQAMLHAIRELREHFVGNVARRLSDEIHAHAFGANELDHLYDFA